MTDCDCGFEVSDMVSFAGGQGEISKIDHRETGPCLLHIHTEDGLEKRPSSMNIEKLDTGVDLLGKGEFDSPERFDLRLKAAELGLAHRQDRFVALTGSRIDIEPYQVQAAYEVLNSLDHRYLIGDEVGLGKTIEAAIVIEELIARGRADRVLIVTPAPLTVQWQEEMRDKFDRDYQIYDRGYVEAKRKAHPNENVWTHDDRIITSIDFAKQDDLLAALQNLEQEWDIAVFDESHHLTARRKGNNTKETTERYRVGKAVARNSEGLLFLTGTPHKGKADQFYFMMDLLAPYRFRDEHDITPDALDDLMIRRLKEDMYEPDGSRMFPEKNIETLPVSFTDEERALYDNVTDYISEHYNLAEREDNNAVGFAMAIYQKRLVSSIYAIRKSLKKRLETLKSGGKDPDDLSSLVKSLLDQYRTDPEMLTDAQRERVEEELGEVTLGQGGGAIEQELDIVRDLYNQAKSIQTDSKAERLREFVDGVLGEDPDEKVLIFTEYTDTLEYLRERVFSNHDVAQIYGDLSQDQRRRELEKFRDEANIMLATDAAREGLNLQFAHIMVNYDLPWNPIRIDQRIGRLHRYGQEHTVEIRNLFVSDTRESDILEVLMEKVEEIESTLGMSSDVLGMVLDEFDLENQIMTAIAKDQSVEQFAEMVDETVEEHEDAIRRIEEDFLIRDRFDLSAEDREILDVIEESRTEQVSETDIETLVRSFFDLFDGEIRGTHPGPAREGGDVFQLIVPDVIDGGEVESRYDRATFSRDLAQEDDELTFLALDHPLVQNIVEFCLRADAVGGQTAVRVGSEETPTPGLLCNYRLGYQSGRGDTVTERLAQIYVQPDGTITENPEIVGGIPPGDAPGFEEVATVSEVADDLIEVAETEAWERVNELAEEAQSERSREIEIKRKHARRYFESRIEEQEERLERYRQRASDPEEDVQVLVNQTERKLADLRSEREAELSRLEEEEVVVPEEPELVNAAVVIGM
ncbi:helicase-related protein [Haloglomus salinum]|uniref:helicase-related protein n=1 Tax=Haloglomus salinum TaxID=2962673 RepID=UPI0020C9853A|nr:helicase-related protein [Haloglomus salinum]